MAINSWIITPEVAGGLGENTALDPSVHPPRVDHLHYELSGWLGDDLLEAFPCFIVTDRLARELLTSQLSGWSLAEVEITTNEEFEEFFSDTKLPSFRWLRIHGASGADFHINSRNQ